MHHQRGALTLAIHKIKLYDQRHAWLMIHKDTFSILGASIFVVKHFL